ncbi:MAG: DNA polymerase III subunit gamma/tau [Planctomycetes bacterium]|nr:DNA polymerase III subunit gamma/tau [Planctomycetota bacterium]
MAAARGKQASEGPYQVVARRFRPQTFQEVVGQDEVLQSLRMALRDQRVPHAFLFSGSRGVGKTTSARILARCLNCEHGPTADPCGTCDLCRSILDGSNPDVIEIDAASNNGVDDVRALREQVGFATMRSRYRVVILDEVHMLSKPAFNALLKTLEEPPPQVVFVLATTELHKVPETIRSRCQVLLFRRVGDDDLKKRLQMIAAREQVEVADEVLDEIAASVRGGVRDAETALERVLPLLREQGKAFGRDAYRTMVARVGIDATIEVTASLLQGDARAALHFARQLQQNGTDEREALGELVEMLRWVMLLQIDGADSGLVPIAGALRQRLQELAAGAEPHQLDAMITAGVLGRERLRRLEDRGAVLEVALVRMAQAAQLPTVADLLAEVRAGGGMAALPAGAHAPAPTRTSNPPAAAPRAAAAAPTPPRPAAMPSTPPADAADLRARTLQMLQDRALLQASVEQCRFAGPDAQGRVVVTLHSERKLHQDRLQSPVIQQELTQVIRTAAAAEVTVEFRIGDAAGGAAAPGAAANQAEPGPTAKRVLQKFRGRVVQVNPEDRRREAPRPADADGAQDDVPPEPSD